MAQDRQHERGDVVARHVVAAIHERPRLGGERQEHRGAHARAVLDVLAHDVRRERILRTRGPDEIHRETIDRLGDRDLPDEPLELHDLFGSRAGLNGRNVHARRVAVDDRDLLVPAQVVEDDVEQESVELRLGQGIGAFEFDRILRREHEERPLDVVVVSAHRHREFLHGLEQRRLGLRRRAIDLVSEQDIREDRAGDECPGPMARRDVLLDDVRAGDVGGHQVGRELDAIERQAERVGERAHEQRLGGSGHARDQAVAADEQRQQQVLDDFLLADDDLADLDPDTIEGFAEAPDKGHRFFVLELAWNFDFNAQRTISSNSCCASR